MLQLKLSTKILLSSMFYIAIFGVVVLAWLVPTYNKAVDDLIDSKTKDFVETTYNILVTYNQQVETKVMTLQEAQEKALEVIKNLRYEDHYYWINDLEPRMIMHPVDQTLYDRNLSEYQDATGKRIFLEFVNICKSKGSGLVHYQWPKPGATEALEKVSYVKLFPAWKWIIGTGIYVEEAKKEVNVSHLATTAIMIFIVLIGVGFLTSIFISRTISRPFNTSIRNLSMGAEQVAAASAQLSVSSRQLSGGSSEQATAIEETSSTLEESASMIQQNTEHTKQAALLAKQAKELSDKGTLEMQEMMVSMGELKKSSSQIGKIIKVIDDIAFQTNILALNAAIEAARAGEAGMGFAVVAEEVRNLAQRSAQAAKDTTAIIESNIDLSDKGTQVVDVVKNSLSEIANQTKKVSELMEEIAAASQEQYQGIDQVNKAIAQVEVVTQQNASSSEENSSASEELSAQSQSMMESVRKLSLLINGHRRNTTKTAENQDHSPQVFTHPVHHGSLKEEGTHEKARTINPEDVIPLEKDKF